MLVVLLRKGTWINWNASFVFLCVCVYILNSNGCGGPIILKPPLWGGGYVCVCVCDVHISVKALLSKIIPFLQKAFIVFFWLWSNAKKCLKRKNDGMKVWLTQHKNGLLKITCGTGAEINRLIRNLKIDQYRWELNMWLKGYLIQDGLIILVL